MKSSHMDILGRVPKENDLILTMIVSRDSDGMRYGIWHKNMIYSISKYHYVNSMVKSVPSNFYIVENPTDKELDIKENLVTEVNKQIEFDNIKPLKSSEYVIGHMYEDRKGNKRVYLGSGKIKCSDGKKYEGYLYLSAWHLNIISVIKSHTLEKPLSGSSFECFKVKKSFVKDLGKVIDIVDNPCVFSNSKEWVKSYYPKTVTIELFDVKNEKER